MKHPVTLSPTYAIDILVVASFSNLLMYFNNLLKASACSQLTCLLGSPFHRTRYSITRGTLCLLVTRSAKIFLTFFSREALDGCRSLHFQCLECCFFLPIKFIFPLVTLSMYVWATSTRSPFASFTCTLDSKEVLGVLGFELTWRAPSSYISPYVLCLPILSPQS